jgi:hypothetical protein
MVPVDAYSRDWTTRRDSCFENSGIFRYFSASNLPAFAGLGNLYRMIYSHVIMAEKESKEAIIYDKRGL